MGLGVMDLCWACLETCLELPKSRYLFSYIGIWWINSKVPEGSMNTSENNSVVRESSRVIILKSRLNSTGHSACTHEVRDIFQWLMTADVLARSQRQRPFVILQDSPIHFVSWSRKNSWRWRVPQTLWRRESLHLISQQVHQLCVDTECRLEDLPRAMYDGNLWWERVKEIRAVITTWWWRQIILACH